MRTTRISRRLNVRVRAGRRPRLFAERLRGPGDESLQLYPVLCRRKYRDHDGGSIAVVRYNPPRHDDAANAERIVACVNACTGITTEALENGVIKHLLKEAFMRTLNPFAREQQRISDMTYLGKPIFEEDFEEDE